MVKIRREVGRKGVDECRAAVEEQSTHKLHKWAGRVLILILITNE